jgi:hypothetical protein
MNMGVPDTPVAPFDEDTKPDFVKPVDKRPNIVVTGNNISINLRNGKRRRESGQWSAGLPTKHHVTDAEWSLRNAPVNPILASQSTRTLVEAMTGTLNSSIESPATKMAFTGVSNTPPYQSERTVAPGLRHTSLHDVLRYIINDSLKVGGRPESAIAEETDYGEVIEVRSRLPNEEERVKIVEWKVDPHVPESILGELDR